MHKPNDHGDAKKQTNLFPVCTFNLHNTYAFITNNNYFVFHVSNNLGNEKEPTLQDIQEHFMGYITELQASCGAHLIFFFF